MWTAAGPQLLDSAGNVKADSSVHDAAREDEASESPVALLSTMDLNCDDLVGATMIQEELITSNSASEPKPDANAEEAKSDHNSDLLKKLHEVKTRPKTPKKAAVVIEDDDEQLDVDNMPESQDDQI